MFSAKWDIAETVLMEGITHIVIMHYFYFLEMTLLQPWYWSVIVSVSVLVAVDVAKRDS
jgi:hypothetical protein